jgi:hypothetical protein
MIQPAKYNGINFSYDFNRESPIYNFDNQRRKNYINRYVDLVLCFYSDVAETVAPSLKCISKDETVFTTTHTSFAVGGGFVYFMTIDEDTLQNAGTTVFFKFDLNGESIYSEIYEIQQNDFLIENEICKILAYNNDSRHGYLTSTNQAFGFFKFSKLKSDIFLTKKVEYEYSYSRKKILSAENQIAKRFTFHDLTMYQSNLLKWLCNCENLSIDGTSYQLISDFTELESDPNSEVMSLQADFVEVLQSFFGSPSTKQPTNIFINNFFM